MVSLVSQSKKALQRGQQLCSVTSDLSQQSSQIALDVLNLDSRVRWITEGVIEQLKLAANIAKGLEAHQNQLALQRAEWETSRTEQSNALDMILDGLSEEHIPPEFYQPALEGAHAIFGFINDKGEPEPVEEEPDEDDHHWSHRSLNGLQNGVLSKKKQRRKWKTLRDFIDEKGIEETYESIEETCSSMDDILATSAEYSTALLQQITSVKGSLPSLSDPIVVAPILGDQDGMVHEMAAHLEALATHYSQVESALTTDDDGEELSEEDIEVLISDTQKLPSVVEEMEGCVSTVRALHERLKHLKTTLLELLANQEAVLGTLEELGDNMTAMLDEQAQLEGSLEPLKEELEMHLETLSTLRTTYQDYQSSYHHLILELERRRTWSREIAAEVERMREILMNYLTEEIRQRDIFTSLHGNSLPHDLCLSIGNLPTQYDVIATLQEAGSTRLQVEPEDIPPIPEDIVEEVGSMRT
ncbi:hypothetical protein SISSUDRAFT_984005 [Sistotremastrum suecicum HHB10207 ss-3]|uniref:Autophagy-related protein 17 n=1 Tax=Sistotremastrum suecicum HHB10207 ss-3 TaxID=1314776 RepID=A0A166EV15_9AGAM|nr:hypothetical protein SISSUDRAFT_984005 [Sistotremastrum suecicum HHB10207 ss-3]